MHRFVLTGTYSSYNKGDAAMELCALQELQRRFEDAEVTITTPNPERDRLFYRGARVVASRRRQLVRGSLEVFRALAWRLLRDRSGIDLRRLISDPETRALSEADLVIDLSGDMLTEDYGPHVAYSHFLPLLAGIALGKRVFVCAQSIGPFSMTRFMARFVLRHTAKVTARDEITLGHLAELRLPAGLVSLTADLAFLLRPASPERVDEILRAEGVPRSEEPLFGVSLSALVADKYARKNPLARTLPFELLLARALDRIVVHHGVRVVFIAHVVGPRQEHDDRRVADRVVRHMRHAGRVVVLRGDYGPDELKGVISRCRAFVGARMHANIAALSSAVPTVALAYSHKAPGIMALFGQADRVLAADSLTPEAIERALDSVLAEAPAVAATLRGHIPRIEARAEENLEVVARLVSRANGSPARSAHPTT